MITIIAADPGTGKTNLINGYLSALVTRGGTAPDGGKIEPGHVVIWSGEDLVRKVLLPMFLANSGNPAMIHFVEPKLTAKGMTHFDPAKHMPQLNERIKDLIEEGKRVSLVVIDSIADIIVGDGAKNTAVRRSFAPLSQLAADCWTSVVGISHLNKKSENGLSIHRVMDSVGFTGVPRSVWIAAKVKGESRDVLLVRAKNNVGPDTDGFKYSVEKTTIPNKAGIMVKTTKVVIGEFLEGKPDELFKLCNGDEDGNDKPETSAQKAEKFILTYLTCGSVKSTDLEQAAQSNGIRTNAFRNARVKLCSHWKEGGMHGYTMVDLIPKYKQQVQQVRQVQQVQQVRQVRQNQALISVKSQVIDYLELSGVVEKTISQVIDYREVAELSELSGQSEKSVKIADFCVPNTSADTSDNGCRSSLIEC